MNRLVLLAAASLSLVSSQPRAKAEPAEAGTAEKAPDMNEPDQEMLEHLDLLLDMDVVENLDMVELAPLLAGGHEPKKQGKKDAK